MQALFFICALVGGTVMVCQFVMTLLGIGADADMPDDLGGGDYSAGGDLGDVLDHSDTGHHHHHGSNWLFVKLTFQTVIAAIAFFGLGGMAASSSGMSPWMSIVIAVGAGVAALYIVYWVMDLLHKFNSDGNVQFENAVGQQGSVYISIPPNQEGMGKILLNLQNRTVELRAKSSEPNTLAPGTNVIVLNVIEPGLVDVAPVRETIEA
jgi:membrane protein implicated in regulation of membrane protease activity